MRDMSSNLAMPRGDEAARRVQLLRTVAAVTLAALYLTLDIATSISAYWMVTAGAAMLLTAVVWHSTANLRRDLQRAATLMAFVAIAALRRVDFDSRKPFLRALNGISAGMTCAEVAAAMAPYIRGTGWPENPLRGSGTTTGNPPCTVLAGAGASEELAIAGVAIFRHTNEGWGDSDRGIVQFDSDVVSRVTFSAD